MTQYYLTRKSCTKPDKKCRISIVHGHKIAVVGFEEFEFFAHRPLNDDWDIFCRYVISERQTGAQVGYGMSLKGAFTMAMYNLGKDGLDTFRKRVAAYKTSLVTKEDPKRLFKLSTKESTK